MDPYDSQSEPPDDLNRRLKIVRIDRALFAGIFKMGRPDTYFLESIGSQ